MMDMLKKEKGKHGWVLILTFGGGPRFFWGWRISDLHPRDCREIENRYSRFLKNTPKKFAKDQKWPNVVKKKSQQWSKMAKKMCPKVNKKQLVKKQAAKDRQKEPLATNSGQGWPKNGKK